MACALDPKRNRLNTVHLPDAFVRIPQLPDVLLQTLSAISAAPAEELDIPWQGNASWQFV
jgi:hypothetical protein